MKRNLILIIVFITISFLLIGAASATNVGNVSTQKTVKSDVSNNLLVSTIKSPVNKYLIDSGANKFYWGERGGIFSYSWKTYKTKSGSVQIIVHYKTTTNSWYGSYLITKISKNKLKIIDTSPEVKLYSGHPSETSYAPTSLTPVQYYLKVVRSQIRSDGYFFV